MPDSFLEASETKRQELEKIVAAAIKTMEPEVSYAVGGKKVWGDSSGSIGVHPRHLAAYFVLPRREDVAALEPSEDWAELQRQLRDELKRAGYPVDALKPDFVSLYSQQQCDEEAKGDWHQFLK